MWKKAKLPPENEVSKYLAKRNTKYLRQLRKKATNAEIKFGYVLCELKIPFIFQKGFFKPFHRIADFYVPKRKIIFEIDGGYHKNIKDRDDKKDSWYGIERGMKTIRVLNEEVENIEQLKERLASLI